MYLYSMELKLKNAIKSYLQGETLRKSSKSFHVDEIRVKKVLVRIGKLRSRSEQVSKGKGKYIIKQDALNFLTPEALYWIGFIAADGSIDKNRTRIQIGLSIKDKGHLEKMSKFFGDVIPVITQKEVAALRFSSEVIYKRLIELGITNNKTYTLQIHPSLKYSRDFWRGYIDGDGWLVNTEKTEAIGVCSYLEATLEDFLDFIKTNGILTEQKIAKKNNQELYYLQFKNIKKDQIANLLYKDSTIYLDRKYEIYQKWLEEVET